MLEVERSGPGFGDFRLGSHPVKYVARDEAGNKAVCEMVIRVEGDAVEFGVTRSC